jgi:hypothetical protein
MSKINVLPGDEPPTPEVLAQAIVDIAAGLKKLNASRLKSNAVVLLVHEASGVGKPAVRAVLDALATLEQTYLKPKDRK